MKRILFFLVAVLCSCLGPDSASFTSWFIQPPSTGPLAPSLLELAAVSSNVSAATLVGVTGSGNVVVATSPTLGTPNLGTPSAAVLTNATGLPNAGIVNPSTTVNSETTLGSTCTTAGNLLRNTHRSQRKQPTSRV
jgi:hypothetical protein